MIEDRLTGEIILTEPQEFYENSKHKELVDSITESLRGKTYSESLEIVNFVFYILKNKFTLS